MASTETDDRLLLRLPEVAARLGLGRSTVYELIQRGELPIIRVGRAVRVPVASLRRWVERQTGTAGELRSSHIVGLRRDTSRSRNEPGRHRR